LLILGPFNVSIALNYSSEVKNCASDVFISNIRNPVLCAKAYSFTQNHCPDISVQRGPPNQASRGLQPNRVDQATGLRTVQKTM
jgi:hypothetical protein